MQKSTNNDNRPQSETWIAEKEIDLLPYIQVLFNWWREIGFITLLVISVAVGLYLGYRAFAEPDYRAIATLAFIRQDSNIILDERFQTQSEEGALEVALIRNARRSALAGLVVNGTVASSVIDELWDSLSEDERQPALLMEQVEARVIMDQNRAQSDLIELYVTTNDRIKSAEIANSWAKYYAAQANQLYGQSPDELIVVLEKESAASFALYQIAQDQLESFIEGQQLAVLERQLAERKNIVGLLQANKEAIVQQRLQSQARTLKRLYVENERIRTYLGRAQHLQSEFEKEREGATATNSVALLLLKAQIYGASFDPLDSLFIPQEAGPTISSAQILPPMPSSALPQQPMQIVPQVLTQPLVIASNLGHQKMDPLQLNIDSTFLAQTTATEQAQDIAAVVRGLQLRQETLAAEIQAFSTELLQENIYQPNLTEDDISLNQVIVELDLEIVQLQAKIEAENAHRRLLALQRDLAWDAYQTLSRKTVELNLDSAAPNSEIRFAARAIPPVEPLPIANLQRSLPLVLFAGLMIGIFFAFISTYLGRRPFWSRTEYSGES